MPEDNSPAPKTKLTARIKATLSKKMGPLPVWGWGLIAVGVGGAVWYMGRHRGNAAQTQGGAFSVAAPEIPGTGGGGAPGDIIAPPPNPPIGIPESTPITPIQPTTPSIDNRPPSVRLPSSATIVAPTPEEIAYALNKRNTTTGSEQGIWQGVTEEHTQRLAASLNQTPQGQQQLANVTTAYKKNPTAAELFFTQCALNPEGCKAMFG